MNKLLALTVLLTASYAPAVNYCGGVSHQNTCGRSYNIYPCCPNGGNCTWWAWESVCSNWNVGLVNWGNANTWAGHANVDPDYDLVGPTVGSIATSTLGNFGHVAWVVATDGATVTVTEQNCCSSCGGNVRTIRYNTSKFNSGFVVRRGTQCQCSPGEVQNEACGDCGRRSRTCAASCSWGGWSGCSGADPQGGNQACSNGKLGVCAEARRRCEGGNLTCRALVEPSPERCDARDNDCDGETDEGNPEEGAHELDYAAKRVDSSYPRTLAAGERGTVWVEFRNMGKKTWERGDLWLATQGLSALNVAETWPAWNIAAGLSVPVAPGEVARFAFEVRAPATPGAQLEEKFKLRSPGETPISCPDSELKVPLLVLNAGVDAGQSSSDDGIKHMSLDSRGCSTAPGLGGLLLVLAALRRRSPRHA